MIATPSIEARVYTTRTYTCRVWLIRCGRHLALEIRRDGHTYRATGDRWSFPVRAIGQWASEDGPLTWHDAAVIVNWLERRRDDDRS